MKGSCYDKKNINLNDFKHCCLLCISIRSTRTKPEKGD